jgi:hypothetical protein
VVGPVFSRVFNPSNAIADRMKHVIEPAFSISRRSDIPNQDRVPKATGYDVVVGGVTQMSYGLTNRILVRKDTEGEPQASSPRELLNVSVRQSYYTDAAASQFDPSYAYGFNNRAPNPFSPISLTARAMPLTPLGVDYRVEYDPKALPGSPKLLGMSLNGLFRTADINTSAGWNRTPLAQTLPNGQVTTASNLLQTTTDFRLKQSQFGGIVDFRYDVTRSTLLNQRYVAFYNAQCCGVSFEFQSFHYPENSGFLVPHDRRFNMSFTLAGVGSFSNFFGAFGGGTY